jgi:molybdopterin molybdotransferase
LITFKEAYDIVLEHARLLSAERVDIKKSCNRILATNVISDIDMPPFNKSAMDGYACRNIDKNNILELIEIIPAGMIPQKKISKGQCSKIMTGAMIPDGADTVIIVEESEEKNGLVAFNSEEKNHTYKCKNNICFKGEDITKNELVLSKGTMLRPKHIAVLATVGCATPLVSSLAKIGIIATGSELVEPYKKVEGPKIRNSNSYQLAAQIEQIPAIPKYYGIAEDTNEAIDSAIAKAMEENDVVLISGGVSMGDYDLVPDILKQNGVKLLFDKIAITPGKPVNFGISNKAICFGLPGNPVSTFIQFEILVKPFLYKMMGYDFKPKIIPLKVGKTIKRKKANREAMIPVILNNGKIYPVEYHGSAHINAMCVADYLLSIPKGITEVAEGSIANVRQI